MQAILNHTWKCTTCPFETSDLEAVIGHEEYLTTNPRGWLGHGESHTMRYQTVPTIETVATSAAQDRCANVPNHDRDIRATQSARRQAAMADRIAKSSAKVNRAAKRFTASNDGDLVSHLLYSAVITD